jgi:hypothetical protein
MGHIYILARAMTQFSFGKDLSFQLITTLTVVFTRSGGEAKPQRYLTSLANITRFVAYN